MKQQCAITERSMDRSIDIEEAVALCYSDEYNWLQEAIDWHNKYNPDALQWPYTDEKETT